MRQNLSRFFLYGFTTGALTVAMLMGAATARAASDAHCFSKSTSKVSGVIYADDIDARLETSTSADERAALEEFERQTWALRMSQTPWLNDGNYLPTQGGKRLMVSADGRLLTDPYDAMALDLHKERMSSITGSKYIFVSPAMKKLARQRSQLRSLKRKPCNPHILYLGG
ncbi:MAG: hypothetical protein AAFO77_05680 [Pseudomonadota bacterium]